MKTSKKLELLQIVIVAIYVAIILVGATSLIIGLITGELNTNPLN